MKSDTILEQTVWVGVDELFEYDKNPRIGNVAAIAESLEENKQYRPIVVQKNSNKVLAGNHTLKAAKYLGWDEIAVTFVEVDDEQAAKIVLADNRTNDLATYDPEILAEVLGSVPDPVGTGYSAADYQVLLESVSQSEIPTDIIDDIVHPSTVRQYNREDERREDLLDQAAGKAVGGVVAPDVTSDDTATEFEDVSGDLQGILELKEDMIFPYKDQFGFAELLPHRLAKENEIPWDKVITWGGPEANQIEDNDGSEWYWWNYGLGSSKTIPFERTILGFYTYDDKFENWWSLPAYYTAKMLNAGIKYIVTPDFSLWEEQPPALHIFNIYRAQWLARYFQEAGLTLIPRLQFGNKAMFDLYVKYGLPDPGVADVAAISLQTFDRHNPEEVQYSLNGLNMAVDYSRPKVLLVYAGPPGHRLAQQSLGMTEHKPKLILIDNYAKVRRDTGVFDKSERHKGTKEQRVEVVEEWADQHGIREDEEEFFDAE